MNVVTLVASLDSDCVGVGGREPSLAASSGGFAIPAFAGGFGGCATNLTSLLIVGISFCFVMTAVVTTTGLVIGLVVGADLGWYAGFAGCVTGLGGPTFDKLSFLPPKVFQVEMKIMMITIMKTKFRRPKWC